MHKRVVHNQKRLFLSIHIVYQGKTEAQRADASFPCAQMPVLAVFPASLKENLKILIHGNLFPDGSLNCCRIGTEPLLYGGNILILQSLLRRLQRFRRPRINQMFFSVRFQLFLRKRQFILLFRQLFQHILRLGNPAVKLRKLPPHLRLPSVQRFHICSFPLRPPGEPVLHSVFLQPSFLSGYRLLQKLCFPPVVAPKGKLLFPVAGNLQPVACQQRLHLLLDFCILLLTSLLFLSFLRLFLLKPLVITNVFPQPAKSSLHISKILTQQNGILSILLEKGNGLLQQLSACRGFFFKSFPLPFRFRQKILILRRFLFHYSKIIDCSISAVVSVAIQFFPNPLFQSCKLLLQSRKCIFLHVPQRCRFAPLPAKHKNACHKRGCSQ